MIYRFESFELDEAKFALLRNGAPIDVEPKALRLLLYLARNPGRLMRKQELLDAIWLDTAVGENALTRSIALLRKALEDSSREPRFIATVPTAGYRFLAVVQVLEQESGAGAVPQPVPGLPAAVGASGRRSSFVPVALLVAGLALMAGAGGWRILAIPRRSGTIRSIAVLPLENLSGDASQDYFADGMTDELTTMLAKNSTLRIVSRTSVMQYKGVHRPLPEIGRELGVDGVIEGSIARSGEKVHINLQLLQALSDTHVWAESYDRNAQELVSFPGEASLAIARRLGSAAAHPAAPRLVNAEAHDDYLRGRYLWFQFKNEEAGSYFRKATALQPDYALGWAGLADYYGQGVIDGEMDPAGSLDLQWSAARRAVELDDSLPEAHLALAAATVTRQWNLAQADREIARALELNPGFSEAYNFRAKVYMALHRDQEALQAERKATELAPFERPFALAMVYFMLRQYDAAIDDARVKLEGSPNDASLHWVLCEAYRRKGDFEQSARERELMLLLRGNGVAAGGAHRAFAQGGYHGLLRWEIAALRKRADTRYVSPVSLAKVYAQMGDRERTLDLLEEGYRQHAPPLLWIQNDTAYDFLHGDERYRAIIRGMGLPEVDSPGVRFQ